MASNSGQISPYIGCNTTLHGISAAAVAGHHSPQRPLRCSVRLQGPNQVRRPASEAFTSIKLAKAFFRHFPPASGYLNESSVPCTLTTLCGVACLTLTELVTYLNHAETSPGLARESPHFHSTTLRRRFISGPDQAGSQGLVTLCTGVWL